MLKRKTFNLVYEEAAKKRAYLYEPKLCRHMNYIMIPALMVFILLLILMNVNYPDRTNQQLSTVQTFGATVTVTTFMPMFSAQKARSYNIWLNNVKNVPNVATCNDLGGERCTILCSNGNLNNLAADMEIFKPSCSGDLSLILNNCSFPSQKLMPTTFNGRFHLRSLEIIDSDLVEIVDGALDIESMSRLMVLNLSTIDMSMLTDKSFDGLIGLKTIQELKFSNVPISQKFVGVKFLQPLAETLQQVSINQKSNSVINDPFSWFDGNKQYSSVRRVDLGGTNFANTLTEKTFSNFPAVHELILADCALTELDVNIFAGMMKTLQYLDLSSNALKTLNVSALSSKNELRLELHGNKWNCTCENYELIKALQASRFTYEEEPLCMTPLQCKDKPLKEVKLKCEEELPKPPSSFTPSPVVSESTSPSTTKNIVTTSSTESTTTPTLNTTPNLTETTYKTNSSVETPSNTTTSSIITTSPVETSNQTFKTSSTTTTINNTSTFDTTDISLEISPSSSTSSKSEKTERSADGKTTTITTAASIITTISSPPKQSTTTPVNLIALPCRHIPDAATTTNYTIFIYNFDIRVTVRATSSSSVVLLISSFKDHLRLIYFTANNRTYVSSTVKSGARNLRTSTAFTIIHVGNLYSNETYIFCLKSTEDHTKSPSNCQSYHIEDRTLEESTAWLHRNDQAWFCILLIFIIILTLCLGLLAIYWLLRWRPTWLRGCKRIIKTDAVSHEVYLLPKPSQKSSEQDDSTCYNERNSHRMPSNMSLDFDSCDYIQYYKDMQDAYINGTKHTSSSILSPNEQAPAVPQNQGGTILFHPTNPADNLIEHSEAVDDNDYQSIVYYEQLC